MSKNRSEALSQNLDNTIESGVVDRLKQLKGFIDPELFEQFNQRILDIVEKNPEAKEIIAGELDKTTLLAQQSVEAYQRRYQSILLDAANDDCNDEDFDDENRPYGGLGKVA